MSGLLGPAEVRRLAARLGIRPTKTLGQNFVVDPNTVRRIVAAADLRPGDVALEVGPGLGSLTLGLLPAPSQVYAVEIDPVLAAALPSTVAAYAPELADRLTVVATDALRLRPGDLVGPAPTVLVANLPYNVAVPVVLRLLAEFPSLRRGLVMVQSEVADRLVAAPGSRVYGVPSVKLAWYASARRAGAVPRTVFWPVPNVDSGLVAFTRREPPAVPPPVLPATPGRPAALEPHEMGLSSAASPGQRDAVSPDQRDAVSPDQPGIARVDREAVFAVVDAAFAQRRKTLRSALARWAGGASTAEELLRTAGVDPGARGESLTAEQFTAIAAARRGASG